MYKIIAIEREYASGGSEIGERLAAKLGIPCYGREILERAAQARGTTPEQIVHMEEATTGSFLYTIALAAKLAAGESCGLSEENQLYLEEAKIIWTLANQGSCVIVGRCAGWVLKERKDVLKVYIHADRDFRTKRAVTIYHDAKEHVDGILRRCDKRRGNFYSANTGKKWDDKSEYHLMLDSGKLGIEGCVEVIGAACQG